MIPKVIHYIWLGGKPLPKITEKCIESWNKYCPDYEIKRWDETNLDIDKYKFAKDAYEAKKFAFASDVFRTDILYKEGGIYLDVDVELVKPIDDLILDVDCVMGFETSNLLNPGLFIAAQKGCDDLGSILEIYKALEFDVNKLMDLTVCEIYTKYFQTKGLIRKNSTQKVGNNMFYASEYFSPIDVISNKKKITKNTCSIHWYNASWYTPKQKMKNRVKRILNFCTFGLAGKVINKLKGKRNEK